MIQSKKLFQYDTMFAIIVLISAISLLGMFLVDQLGRTILKWKRIDKLVNGVKIKLTKCKEV